MKELKNEDFSATDRVVQIAAERIEQCADLGTIQPTTEWSAFADCIEVRGADTRSAHDDSSPAE